MSTGKVRKNAGKNVVWSDVDWNTQDVVIAEKKGVSRQRVFQVREKLGKRASTRLRSRRHSATNVLSGINTKDLTIHEIADKTGYTLGHLRNVLKNDAFQYKAEDRRCIGKYSWDTLPLESYYLLSDKQIAKCLGIKNSGVVSLHRIRNHLLRRINALKDITCEQFRSMTDEQVSKRTHAGIKDVRQYRWALANGLVEWPKYWTDRDAFGKGIKSRRKSLKKMNRSFILVRDKKELVG